MLQIQTINFKSDILEVINQGISFISIATICSNIGISKKYQIAKIKKEDSYDSKYIEVQTAKGIQNIFCIPLSQLNGWLFSINPSKVKPEVKENLIRYKKECFDVLFKHFNKSTPNLNKKISDLEEQIKRLENRAESPKLLSHKNSIDLLIEETQRELERENKNWNFFMHRANHLIKIIKALQAKCGGDLPEAIRDILNSYHDKVLYERNQKEKVEKELDNFKKGFSLMEEVVSG